MDQFFNMSAKFIQETSKLQELLKNSNPRPSGFQNNSGLGPSNYEVPPPTIPRMNDGNGRAPSGPAPFIQPEQSYGAPCAEQEAFDILRAFDRDDKGFVTEKDFVIAAFRSGYGYHGEMAAKITFRKLDTDKNGVLDLKEAVKGLALLKGLAFGDHNPIAFVRAYDQDNKGYITERDFLKVAYQNGYSIVGEIEARNAFRMLDKNGNGILDLNEAAKGFDILREMALRRSK
ncbi:unnamed protein product [Brachionus calyciflorus]|uniref:EF-hand domain-containing protein n=1 Tax=Brachionus calyciflorus TaxID=104777 RepID=A0A813LX04_9BILA|nr:unnamed protein product [Brachionus calyciflorus]